MTKQKLKSQETKERIFEATKAILQKSGYENLSIKNICEEAGVSNGSFYHHFKTKDDLLSYYVVAQPSMTSELSDLPQDKEEAKNAIVEVYRTYATYCKELGPDFIAGYYTPRNQALNPDIRMLVIGNAFEWAMRGGKVDMEQNIRRSLSHYLDSVLK